MRYRVTITINFVNNRIPAHVKFVETSVVHPFESSKSVAIHPDCLSVVQITVKYGDAAPYRKDNLFLLGD